MTWDPCGPLTETQPEPKQGDQPSGCHLRSQLQVAGDPAELVGLRWALACVGPWASRLGATCADGRGMAVGGGGDEAGSRLVAALVPKGARLPTSLPAPSRHSGLERRI